MSDTAFPSINRIGSTVHDGTDDIKCGVRSGVRERDASTLAIGACFPVSGLWIRRWLAIIFLVSICYY